MKGDPVDVEDSTHQEMLFPVLSVRGLQDNNVIM
jgi:hypothetical protein